MSPQPHPPYAITAVRDACLDGLLCGSAGWLVVPAGGTVKVNWRTSDHRYRLTIDLVAGRKVDLDTACDWLPVLAARNAAVPELRDQAQYMVGTSAQARKEREL